MSARVKQKACPAHATLRIGFTLIELLVVVAIIALLISILLPSLRRAREQGKAVVCMANMRSVGQAFTMYGEEHRGLWPPGVDSQGSQNRWPVPFFKAGIIKEELFQWDTAGNMTRIGGPSVFICPSEKGPRAIPNWRDTGRAVDRVEIGGSYSYNEELHRKPLDSSGALVRGTILIPPFTNPIGHCRRPAEVIQLGENFRSIEAAGDKGWRYNRDDFWEGYRSRTGAPVAQGDSADRMKKMGTHHLEKMNAMAIDTHVFTKEPKTMVYSDISWTLWDKWPELPPGGM